MCEAENVINNHPFTYLSDDIGDLQRITPYLFRGADYQSVSSPPLPINDDIDYSEDYADCIKISDCPKLDKNFLQFTKSIDCPNTEKNCPSQPVFRAICGPALVRSVKRL